MAKKRQKQHRPSDDLATVLQNGADLARRRLYLCGEIDEELSYRFIVGLQTMDESDGIISVVMNTCGGTCQEGFAIYDAIKFARNDVYIIGFGQVASMGSIIMQAGSKRLLSAECDFMIHDVGVVGAEAMSLKDANLLNHQLQRLQRRGNRILSLRSQQTEEQIVRWCADETTFSAEQTVEAGFADSVLVRFKKTPNKKVRK